MSKQNQRRTPASQLHRGLQTKAPRTTLPSTQLHHHVQGHLTSDYAHLDTITHTHSYIYPHTKRSLSIKYYTAWFSRQTPSLAYLVLDLVFALLKIFLIITSDPLFWIWLTVCFNQSILLRHLPLPPDTILRVLVSPHGQKMWVLSETGVKIARCKARFRGNAVAKLADHITLYQRCYTSHLSYYYSMQQ